MICEVENCSKALLSVARSVLRSTVLLHSKHHMPRFGRLIHSSLGHLVKKFVSSSYEGVLQILHDQLGWLVLVMTLFTSSTVIVFHRRYGSGPANFRKKMK